MIGHPSCDQMGKGCFGVVVAAMNLVPELLYSTTQLVFSWRKCRSIPPSGWWLASYILCVIRLINGILYLLLGIISSPYVYRFAFSPVWVYILVHFAVPALSLKCGQLLYYKKCLPVVLFSTSVIGKSDPTRTSSDPCHGVEPCAPALATWHACRW